LALDDKFDDIKKLIDVGKEKGYLTYDEVNDLIPHDVHSPEDLDDLITTIGGQGIDVLEGPKSPSALDKFDKGDIEAGEDVELDLTPGALEKTNDPVRMYLREMGTVPLLTREGEVEIAKRIERGQLRVLKALSRSPIVIREIIAMGEDLKRGVRSIKEVVLFDEDEITEEVLDNRRNDITGRIDELNKHYKKSQQLVEKLAGIVPKKNARLHRKTRWALGREQVAISHVIRKLGFTNTERKRLIDRVNKTVDSMRGLDKQAVNFEKRAEATRSDEQRKELRKQVRGIRSDLERM
jgi:RNA polymerase primary sigma factor